MHTRTHRPFDPHAHRAALSAILDEIARAPELDARALDRIVKRHPKAGASLFSKSEILAGLRAFGADADALLEARLRLRPVRTLSGVTPVAVLTRPHPCPGTCVFCPSDVRMPKSYLADEPGAQRAEANRFDPYLQTWSRLDAYRQIGHPTDKVELIVLGGTFSAYPEPYRIWFTLRCLEALSDFGAGVDARADAGVAPAAAYRRLPALDGRARRGGYNAAVGGLLRETLGPERLHASERASWEALAAAQRRNESAGCRAVGIAFETRPDHLDTAELLRLRRLGATRIQVGIQSTDDALLARNGRGHDLAATRAALSLLRRAGMKIHAHWMPNLLGATPEGDAADFERLFADEALRPDELKIYPCLLVESAPLAAEHARGAWRPYPDAVLVELLAGCLARTPRWCRVTRVVRDFSAPDIVAGTRVANLREVVERRLDAQGLRRQDIRSREVRGAAVDEHALRLRQTPYATADGEERFLEWVAPDDRVAAFLRLSLPRAPSFVAELGAAAIVRELHVYGPSLRLSQREAGSAQHAGLGRRLLAEAARVATARGYRELAVISAVGTREYYRARGFADGALYQHRELG